MLPSRGNVSWGKRHHPGAPLKPLFDVFTPRAFLSAVECLRRQVVLLLSVSVHVNRRLRSGRQIVSQPLLSFVQARALLDSASCCGGANASSAVVSIRPASHEMKGALRTGHALIE